MLPKLFWSAVRKNCFSDWEKLLKFEADGWEFAKILRSLEQFIQTAKGQNYVFFSGGVLIFSNKLEQLEFKLEKKIIGI